MSKRPYNVDYGKPKKKSFGFFKFLFLVVVIAVAITLFKGNLFETPINVSSLDIFSSQEEQLSQLKKEIDVSEDFRREIDSLNQEINKLKGELNRNLTRINDYEALYESKVKKIGSLEGEIKSLNQLNDELVVENELLKKSPEDENTKTNSDISNYAITSDIGNLNITGLITKPFEIEDASISKEIPNLSRKPKAIKTINPRYPRRALERGVEGLVVVEFDIDKEGNTTNVRVKESSNYLFNSEALRVVRISKFQAALDSNG